MFRLWVGTPFNIKIIRICAPLIQTEKYKQKKKQTQKSYLLYWEMSNAIQEEISEKFFKNTREIFQ